MTEPTTFLSSLPPSMGQGTGHELYFVDIAIVVLVVLSRTTTATAAATAVLADIVNATRQVLLVVLLLLLLLLLLLNFRVNKMCVSLPHCITTHGTRLGMCIVVVVVSFTFFSI